MIAHNSKLLDERMIRKEAILAFAKKLITAQELDAVMKARVVRLYSPNLFIRIGLFILTTIIASMGFGLFVTMFSAFNFSESGFAVICLLFSIGLYASLEYLIRMKNHYHSGLDDALLWLSAGFFVGAFYILFSDIPPVLQAFLFLLVSLLGMLRFLSPVMSGVAFLSMLALIFYALSPLGVVGRMIMPFVLMILSLLIYWPVKICRERWSFRHYHACLLVIEVLALFCAYAAVNYLVVRELSIALFGLRLQEKGSLPGGWFFWTATISIPLIYLTRGLQKKDAVLLRMGLVLIVASIYTVHYYYSVAPVENVIAIGGAVMILAMYFVSRYFREPRHGITNQENNDPGLPGFLQVESLIVAETFHQAPVADSDKGFQFGGGSSGGGGASGEF